MSDVDLAITLFPERQLTLVALRDGEPDFENGEALQAEVDGRVTVVRVAAGRLRHALDQLDARRATLCVSGHDEPPMLTAHDEPRVLVVSQSH